MNDCTKDYCEIETVTTNLDHIKSLDAEKFAMWLCGQMWEDFRGRSDGLDLIRYTSTLNFLRSEYKPEESSSK